MIRFFVGGLFLDLLQKINESARDKISIAGNSKALV
jgi:hypothetical protein